MWVKLKGNAICHGDFSGNPVKIAQFVEGKDGLTDVAKAQFIRTVNCGAMMLDYMAMMGQSDNITDVMELLKELRRIKAIYDGVVQYSEEQSE
jgi:hypothetical protein